MDQRERFEAAFREKYGEQPLYRRDMKGSTRFGEYCNHVIQSQWEIWQAAEAALLERAITAIQSDSDAADELGHERFSRYCAEVVAKLRNLAAPVERGGE
jgi:hypothetical protein